MDDKINMAEYLLIIYVCIQATWRAVTELKAF